MENTNINNSSDSFTKNIKDIKQFTDNNLKNESTSLEEPSKKKLEIDEISNDKKEESQKENISSNNNEVKEERTSEQKEDIISDKKLNNETEGLKKELDELQKKMRN